MIEMKTLEINNEEYEIIDENARNDIESLNNSKASNESLNNTNNDIDYLKNKIVKSRQLKTIAHRGVMVEAPENTIPAYRRAGIQKFWGAECDIAMTSDGEFILMHDNTVDRTTNGSGLVSELTLEQIKELNIDVGTNIDKYPNLKVPTLIEYLDCCYENGLIPVIELKGNVPVSAMERFVNILKEYGFEKNCVVISFSMPLLERVRELSKYIKIQAILEFSQIYNGLSAIDYCVSKNFDIDTSVGNLSIERVNEAHLKGIEVNCWTASIVNVPTAINFKVDYITANHINDTFTNNNNNSQYAPYSKINDIEVYNEYEKEILLYGGSHFQGELNSLLTRIRNGNYINYPECYYPSYARLTAFNKIPIKDGCRIQYEVPEGVYMGLHLFKPNGTFHQDSGYLTGSGTYTVNNINVDGGFAIAMFKYGSDLYFTEEIREQIKHTIKSVTY